MSTERISTYIGLFLSLLALARAFADGSDAPLTTYAVAAAILAVLTVANLRTGQMGSALIYSDYRASPLSANPNGIALLLSVGVATGMVLAVLRAGRSRLIPGALALICGVGVLATGSRTGVIALAAAGFIVTLLVAPGGEESRRFVRLGVASLTALATVVLAQALKPLLPVRIWDTIDALRIQDLTLRQDIWASVLENTDLWMPWGTGLSTAINVVDDLYGRPLVVHNTFLEIAVETGVVGVVAGAGFYVGIFLASRYSPYRHVILAAMGSIFVFSMTLSLFYYKVLWFIAALAAVRLVHKRGLGVNRSEVGVGQGTATRCGR